MPFQLEYKILINSQFYIQVIDNDLVKFHRDLLIGSTSKLSLKIYLCDVIKMTCLF